MGNETEVSEFNHHIEVLKNEIQSIMNELSDKNITELKESELRSLKDAKLVVLKQLMRKQQAFSNKKGLQRNKEVNVQTQTQTQTYLDYLVVEKLYFQYDPPDVPGYLFLDEVVLNQYGLCPYIKMDLSGSDQDLHTVASNTACQRKKWLQEQDDSGATYYALVEELLGEKERIMLSSKLQDCQESIEEIIRDTLTCPQSEMFNSCIELVNAYISASVKTKKIKEKYNLLVDKLSTLNEECPLQLHEYIAIKYDIQIVVNTDTCKPTKNCHTDKMHTFVSETFSNKLTEYSTLRDTLQKKMRYSTNVVKRLKNELYLYMTNQKNFYLKAKPKNVYQQGKYFKRWILLTEEERQERFKSFSSYYIDKYMVQEGILDSGEINTMVESLQNLLIDAYASKQMIYRDYTWNSKKGFIENVKILRYDRTKNTFWLNSKRVIPNETKSKKKSSTKSIFTKETERVINEAILLFVVKNGPDTQCETERTEGTGNERDTECEHAGGKLGKKELIEYIKNKVKIKKISAADKEKILHKYNDISSVVLTNAHPVSGSPEQKQCA